MGNIHAWPDEHYWAVEAVSNGGGFISKFALAVLSADSDNYAILQSSVRRMMKKYPEYCDKGEDEQV